MTQWRRAPTLAVIPACAFLCGVTSAVTAQAVADCMQPELQFGVDTLENFRSDYAKICCDNQHWAEPAGSQTRLKFFDVLEQMEQEEIDGVGKKWVFYDSQCGVPLFVAPIGRTFKYFKQDSLLNGWPSFRDGEVFAHHVVELAGGELVSSCGTHLGRNLPDRSNRYIVSSICISGFPVAPSATNSSNSSNGSTASPWGSIGTPKSSLSPQLHSLSSFTAVAVFTLWSVLGGAEVV